jgi:hypothetical protein
MRGWSNAVVATALAACLACSTGDDAGDSGPSSDFVATENTFAGFCDWSSAPATPAKSTPLGVHGLDAMRVYWKEAPPHGATEFPVGTVILKESEETTPGDRIVFAMAKRKARGGGYDSDGADGWEWFSLQDRGDCTALILWRGAAAPILTTYSDLIVGDCNGCHTKIAGSDYVFDTALQLSTL